MRIDAHQHFWEYNDTDYVWMGPEHEAIRRDFLPGHLAPLLDSVGFDGSVAVQARQMLEETEWLLTLAERNPRVLGVVGWADLCSERADEQIERYAAHPKLVGVRHVVHDEPEDEFVLRRDFQRGVGLLGPARLTYDLLLFPGHIPPSIRLVDAFPDQRFVIDHIAKPPIATGEVHPWADDLREIARREHVWCKLSGMVTEVGRDAWDSADYHRYLDVVLEAFGPDRLMVGSDWPVCTTVAAYAPVMDIVIDYVQRLTPGERDAILGGSAVDFYGISNAGKTRVSSG